VQRKAAADREKKAVYSTPAWLGVGVSMGDPE